MKGIWTALITPFTVTGDLDISAFKRILRDQVDAGVAGVIPCGTTGESPTLTLEEKKTLIQLAVNELKGTPVQVVAGTGSASTSDSIEFSRWADQQGVHGVLLVTPYYNKPTQSGLVAHFLAIANAISCESILYNVPGRTGVSLSAETVVQLAAHPKIRTLKEASGNLTLTSEILEQLSQNNLSMDILSGDDATFLGLLAVGGVGAISVASNLFPKEMVQMQKAFEAGDPQKAMKIHKHYYPLFRDLFIESNPVPIKYALNYAGKCLAKTRLPLVPLTTPHQEKLNASLAQCRIPNGISS